jgi:hypothetical protein
MQVWLIIAEIKLVRQNVTCGAAHWFTIFIHEAQSPSSNFAESRVSNVSLLIKVSKHAQ